MYLNFFMWCHTNVTLYLSKTQLSRLVWILPGRKSLKTHFCTMWLLLTWQTSTEPLIIKFGEKLVFNWATTRQNIFRSFRPGQTQTGLRGHRSLLEWSASLLFSYEIRHIFSWPGSIWYEVSPCELFPLGLKMKYIWYMWLWFPNLPYFFNPTLKH